MIGASFDSTKTPLHDLLARCDSGKLQLPDLRGEVTEPITIQESSFQANRLLTEPGTHNSVTNKTALAARTNRQIGGRAPSKCLPEIEKAAAVGTERIDEILGSHCIAPKELRADRFWEFYAARAEALLWRIEAATSITRQPELFRAGVVAEVNDEGPEEWDAEEPLEEAAS